MDACFGTCIRTTSSMLVYWVTNCTTTDRVCSVESNASCDTRRKETSYHRITCNSSDHERHADERLSFSTLIYKLTEGRSDYHYPHCSSGYLWAGPSSECLLMPQDYTQSGVNASLTWLAAHIRAVTCTSWHLGGNCMRIAKVKTWRCDKVDCKHYNRLATDLEIDRTWLV